MPDDIEPSEGHSPAAWTGVVIMLIGFVVGTVAFFFDVPVVVFISVGIILLGLATGLIMSKLGYGVHGEKFVGGRRAHD